MELQDIFQKNWDNLVPKYSYMAIVEGRPNPKNGTVTSWLTENKNFVMMSSLIDNGGLKSVTHYKTQKSKGGYSLLDFDLETRRKNQVRVHMQQIGHPIVGALHAGGLILKHPRTGELLEFKAGIPKAMQILISETQKERKDKPEKEESI